MRNRRCNDLPARNHRYRILRWSVLLTGIVTLCLMIVMVRLSVVTDYMYAALVKDPVRTPLRYPYRNDHVTHPPATRRLERPSPAPSQADRQMECFPYLRLRLD